MNAGALKTVYRGFPVEQMERVKSRWMDMVADESFPRNATFRSYIDSLNFESLKEGGRSIIISATLTPVKYSTVSYRGAEYVIRTPHQYFKTDFTAQSVGEYIANREGVKETLLNIRDIPMKLTAAMCGLTQYGRNNIAYTGQYGSYITLMAFMSSEIHFDSVLIEPERMDLCENCRICEKRCPGSALGDRHFLQVENCLTLYNEIEGVFPEEIKKMPHHTLMGCLMCQESCPANRDIDAQIGGELLDEEETGDLFSQNPSKEGLRGLEKLIGISDRKSLKENFPVYARNFHYALKEMGI